MTENIPLVDIKSLSISFDGNRSTTVDQIDFSIARGEVVALVGESGSGKSLLGSMLAGILSPAAILNVDRFTFGGIDLRNPAGAGWKDLRGREIGIVFQNPSAALCPIRKVGQQLGDVIAEHRGLRRAKLRSAVIAALTAVRIPDPERRMSAYPGELSGGMCQRIMIAIALAGNPDFLIADEPTTGLDTTTQAAILELISNEAKSRKMACLLITHDLELARHYAKHAVVMHAGQVVEAGPIEKIFSSPRHPYTAALLASTPAHVTRIEELKGIAGTLPDFRLDVPACRFADRCARAVDKCRIERPRLAGTDTHHFACWDPLT